VIPSVNPLQLLVSKVNRSNQFIARKYNNSQFSESDYGKYKLEGYDRFYNSIEIELDYDKIFSTSINQKKILSSLKDYKKNKSSKIMVNSIGDLDLRIFPTDDMDYQFLDSFAINIRNFFNTHKKTNVKSIHSDLKGPYIYVTEHEKTRLEAEFPNQLIFENSQDQELKQIINNLIQLLLFSFFLILLVLVFQFESFLRPLLILLVIPIGILSGMLTLFVFGYSLNIFSGMGFLILTGIVVNDSILKVNFIDKQIRRTGSLSESLRIAYKVKSEPIILTSLSTIAAMSSVFLFNDMVSDLFKPMAVVVIGGLIISTLASLFLIPHLYHIIYTLEKRFGIK
jgi:hypothetical protein